MANTNTLAERVWYALHCLPRDAAGEPPSFNAFEKAHGLPGCFLSKLFSGKTDEREIRFSSFLALAVAFKDVASFEWLAIGEAQASDGYAPPLPTGPITPLEEKYPRDGRGL